jgi:hypothetical protein
MESENKYKELNRKTAKESAEIVAEVNKYNYLAHSIREIEFAILKLNFGTVFKTSRVQSLTSPLSL